MIVVLDWGGHGVYEGLVKVNNLAMYHFYSSQIPFLGRPEYFLGNKIPLSSYLSDLTNMQLSLDRDKHTYACVSILHLTLLHLSAREL